MTRLVQKNKKIIQSAPPLACLGQNGVETCLNHLHLPPLKIGVDVKIKTLWFLPPALPLLSSLAEIQRWPNVSLESLFPS